MTPLITYSCIFLLCVALGKMLFDRKVSSPAFTETMNSIRTTVGVLVRARDDYRKRAEWAEMYAGQLEKELGIPPADRIDSESWKQCQKTTQP